MHWSLPDAASGSDNAPLSTDSPRLDRGAHHPPLRPRHGVKQKLGRRRPAPSPRLSRRPVPRWAPWSSHGESAPEAAVRLARGGHRQRRSTPFYPRIPRESGGPGAGLASASPSRNNGPWMPACAGISGSGGPEPPRLMVSGDEPWGGQWRTVLYQPPSSLDFARDEGSWGGAVVCMERKRYAPRGGLVHIGLQPPCTLLATLLSTSRI